MFQIFLFARNEWQTWKRQKQDSEQSGNKWRFDMFRWLKTSFIPSNTVSFIHCGSIESETVKTVYKY